MSRMDEWLIFAISAVLVLVAIYSYRSYIAKHEGSGVECQSEARQLAKLSPLRLEDCAPVAAVAGAAPPRAAAKIDRAGLAGEISSSPAYSIALTFEDTEIVLGKRLSWLMRLVGLPFATVVVLFFVTFFVPGAVRVLLWAANFVVYWLSPPDAPGEPSRAFIAQEKVDWAARWVTIACLSLAILALVVSAGLFQTLRFSPATAQVTERLHAYGIPLGDTTARRYELAAPITDTEGRTFIHVYAREEKRLKRIYRLHVRQDRLLLTELLGPARTGS